ncbi:TraX family protein [Scandinavium sp. NPDC088450]|uniref:TraX family protein n=1 Tax=Scandinavium sp. NPDC088450 TaxID=3364514 RepID=UPI00384C9BE6
MLSPRTYPAPSYRERLVRFSPWAIDTVKLVALAAMLIDHANTLFIHPSSPELYALGRMAFPLFIFIWALNILATPERLQQRANRLWLWAIITQPVFTFAFHTVYSWYALNILFVFAVATQFLAVLHSGKPKLILGGLVLAALMVPLLIPASYGIPGLVLAVSSALYFAPENAPYRRAAGMLLLCSLVMLNGIAHLISQPVDTLLVALLPTVVFPLAVLATVHGIAPLMAQRFMPTQFFYLAYAGHLLLYGLLATQ